MSDFLKTLGFKTDSMLFIPYSALYGDNVSAKSDKMPWYTGMTLLESLDSLTVPIKPTDKALRLPVQDVFSISGFGTVPVGRVETGILKVGETVIVMPSGVKAEVKSIEMHHQAMQKAEPGDNIGFNIKGIDRKDIKRGDVIGPDQTIRRQSPSDFTAQVIVLKHPNVITKGYTPVFHIHTAQIACTVRRASWRRRIRRPEPLSRRTRRP